MLYVYIYIYIYISFIYIYINFESKNNVLDAKMVLKTHLFIKIFRLLYRSFVSLIRVSRNIKQKFSKVQFIRKNKLKIVCKTIYVQKQFSSGVLQQRHCTNTKRIHRRTNAQKRIPTIPLCNFIEITPMHVYAPENPHHTRKTPLPRRAHLGDCSCMSKQF